MKVALQAAVFAAFAALACAPVQAQDARGACKADREKFCAGLTPGDGKFGPCMESHAADLSPECKAMREAAKEARKAIRSACKADAAKFCADSGPERMGLAKCLESHSAELEPACAEALKSRPGAKKA